MEQAKSVAFQTSYSDPEFETYYTNLENDLTVFNVKAKQDGLENNPGTLKQYWVRVIILLIAAIQKAIDINYSRSQMYSDIAVVQTLRTSASDKTSLLEKEKNEKEKNLVPLENEKKRLKEKCKDGLSLLLRIIIPALFGFCEGYLVFNMLQSTSIPFVVAFFLALLTSLVAGFGLHLGANFICKAKTLNKKRRRYVIVLGLAFIVAFALGIWRAQSYSDASNINTQIDLSQQTGSPASFSPWPFVIISFVSFIVALAFEVKYWLSDEEKKTLKQYEDKCAEVKKEEFDIQILKREIARIEVDSNTDSSFIMHKQEYACSNEYRLVSLAKRVISRYESINMDFRKDKQCPAFFGEPIDFGFKLYFNKLFNYINENNEIPDNNPV